MRFLTADGARQVRESSADLPSFVAKHGNQFFIRFEATTPDLERHLAYESAVAAAGLHPAIRRSEGAWEVAVMFRDGPLARLESRLAQFANTDWSGGEGERNLFLLCKGAQLDVAYRLESDTLLIGKRSVVYFVEKARRIGGLFAQEWNGSTKTTVGRELLEILAWALPGEPVTLDSRLPLGTFLGDCDNRVHEVARAAVEQRLRRSGVSWGQWRRAGTGLGHRLGFERVFF